MIQKLKILGWGYLLTLLLNIWKYLDQCLGIPDGLVGIGHAVMCGLFLDMLPLIALIPLINAILLAGTLEALWRAGRAVRRRR